MDARDKLAFAKVMTVLGEIYDKPISEERMAAYFQILKDFSVDEISRAATNHTRASKFMPTPADLIERMTPNKREQALLAWPEVPILLRNSRAAKSANPITEKVIQDLGGWTLLGTKTTAELVWVEKEFVSRYEMYEQHGVDVQAISGPRKGLRLIGSEGAANG